MPVIPVLGRLSQEDYELEAIRNTCLVPGIHGLQDKYLSQNKWLFNRDVKKIVYYVGGGRAMFMPQHMCGCQRTIGESVFLFHPAGWNFEVRSWGSASSACIS